MSLGTSEQAPKLMGMDPMEILQRLLDHAGINNGMELPPLATQEARFQYAERMIPILAIASSGKPDSFKSSGLREVAAIGNGGTVEACSSTHDPPKSVFEDSTDFWMSLEPSRKKV